MRAIPLKSSLDPKLWAKRDFNAAAGSDPKAQERKNLENWNKSKTVTRCSYFVSHSWNDEDVYPGKKVEILQAFLCVQAPSHLTSP
jgi:hypothetical protein